MVRMRSPVQIWIAAPFKNPECIQHSGFFLFIRLLLLLGAGAILTGAVSHFAIGGLPDLTVWALCVVFTLLWARVAAVFANRAQPKTLNRATGVVLVILGAVIMGFNGIHERLDCLSKYIFGRAGV